MSAADDFVAQLRERLEAGAREYGDQSFVRPVSAIVAELEQELVDLPGWTYILWCQAARKLNMTVARDAVREVQSTASEVPMMLIGFDPGMTSGWCAYDTEARLVFAAGQFETFAVPRECLAFRGLCVVERPEGYGVTRPQMVDCGYFTGRIVEILRRDTDGDVVELTRREVKKILTAATQRDVVVTDDASAWAALKLLHGGESSMAKDGCLRALRGFGTHGRAALAVALAWHLSQAAAKVET